MKRPPTNAPLFRPSWRPHGGTLAAFRQEQATWRPQLTPQQRGYDQAWRKVRNKVLEFEPHCRACARTGVVRDAVLVDHILTIRERPELRLELRNLQPLCRACHTTKTNREDGGMGNRRQRAAR